MMRFLLQLSVVAGTIAYTIYGAPSGARKRDAAMWAVVIECRTSSEAEALAQELNKAQLTIAGQRVVARPERLAD